MPTWRPFSSPGALVDQRKENTKGRRGAIGQAILVHDIPIVTLEEVKVWALNCTTSASCVAPCPQALYKDLPCPTEDWFLLLCNLEEYPPETALPRGHGWCSPGLLWPASGTGWLAGHHCSLPLACVWLSSWVGVGPGVLRTSSKNYPPGWRDGSVVSHCCSCSGFNNIHTRVTTMHNSSSRV